MMWGAIGCWRAPAPQRQKREAQRRRKARRQNGPPGQQDAAEGLACVQLTHGAKKGLDPVESKGLKDKPIDAGLRYCKQPLKQAYLRDTGAELEGLSPCHLVANRFVYEPTGDKPRESPKPLSDDLGDFRTPAISRSHTNTHHCCCCPSWPWAVWPGGRRSHHSAAARIQTEVLHCPPCVTSLCISESSEACKRRPCPGPTWVPSQAHTYSRLRRRG